METKELAIGEVGVIHGKTVLCAKAPTIKGKKGSYEDLVGCCDICAFQGNKKLCIPCLKEHRTDGNNVFYPEITKGL